MPLISTSIPNLVNGVSQQPDSLRFASQCDLQLNAYSSVVEGLRKRHAREMVAKVYDGQLPDAYTYMINRDTTERYETIISNGDIKIFDLDGVEQTITFPHGKGYLTAANPSGDFHCVTVLDYTFVVNKKTKVLMDQVNLSPDRGVEAIVFIQQADYQTDYTIQIDGATTPQGSYSTGDMGALRTTTIATNLTTDLGALGESWVITRQGPVIHIRRVDGADFEIKVTDSRSNRNMRVFKNKAQRFSELPIIAPRDFVVEIVGDQSSSFDNYYVKFEPYNDTADFDEGVWVETVKPGIPWQLDLTTMPHAIIRQADGNFTFEQVDWGRREVGDEDSAPTPGFVDRTISDIFVVKNRLGVLSDETVIMSRASERFEFFPTTATTLSAKDPIHLEAPSNKASILRYAVPFNEHLLFFSDQTQFNLDIGETLSPETSDLSILTEYEADLTARPIGAGKTVFFATAEGVYAGVREFYVESQALTEDATEVTSHVPRYVPSGIFKMTASANEEVAFILTKGERNAVYVYKFFWSASEKLQSSWSKYEFGGPNVKVLNADFVNTTCYFLVQYSDGVYLERMNVDPGRVDENAPFEYLLDRKVSEQHCSASYDPNSNETTFVLPYQIEPGDEMVAVTRHAVSQVKPPGMILQVTGATANQLKVTGDQTAVPVFIGKNYEMRYRFSRQTLKEDLSGKGQAINAAGRLQIKFWTIIYDETGFFRAEVRTEGRETKSYNFTGRTIGAENSLLGQVSLSKGSFKFPIMSRNDRVQVDIVNNTFLPSRLLSGEWEGLYTIRSQRLS